MAGEGDLSFSQHPNREDKPRTSESQEEPKREIKAKEDVSSRHLCEAEKDSKHYLLPTQSLSRYSVIKTSPEHLMSKIQELISMSTINSKRCGNICEDQGLCYPGSQTKL